MSRIAIDRIDLTRGLQLLLTVWLGFATVGCTAIERRQHASISPVASEAASSTENSAEQLRRDWPDARMELSVLGSKGDIAFVGLLLPLLPLPAGNFDGPSPWVIITVRPRSADAGLAFDPVGVTLEAPNGQRYRPLLVTAPRPPDQCDFGPFLLGPDSLARIASASAAGASSQAGSTPAGVAPAAPTVLDGARCFRVAFRLPPRTAPRYLLHIPRPLAGAAGTPASAEMWTVCVRPRAEWGGDFMPLAPLFGPTWSFLQTRGRADFRDCPPAARPPSPG